MVQRNPWLAGSVGVAAAALMAVLVVTLLYADRQARHAADLANANTRIRTTLSESNRRWRCWNSSAAGSPSSGTRSAWGCSGPSSPCGWRSRRGTRPGGAPLANLSAWRHQLPELKEIFRHEQTIRAVAFSRDGKTIATVVAPGGHGYSIGEALSRPDVNKTISPRPMAGGAAVGCRHRPAHRPTDRASRLGGFRGFSPDGKTILTGAADRPRGCGMRPAGHRPAPSSSTVCDERGVQPRRQDPAHRLLGWGVRRWDRATLRPTGPLITQATQLCAIAFSPDGRSILRGAGTGRGLWDADTGRPIGQTMEHPGYIWAMIGEPPMARRILAGSHRRGGTGSADTATGRQMASPYDIRTRSAAWRSAPMAARSSPGAADRTVGLSNVVTGELVGPPLEHPGRRLCGGVRSEWPVDPHRRRGQRARCGSGPSSRASPSAGSSTNSVRRSAPARPSGSGYGSGRVRVWDIALGQLIGRHVKLGCRIVIGLGPDSRSDPHGERRRDGRALGHGDRPADRTGPGTRGPGY